MILDRVVVSMYGTNCYIFGDEKAHEAVIIDPGGEWQEIDQHVKVRNLAIKAILLTHGHPDHTGAIVKCRKLYGAPVYYNKGDQPFIGPHADKYLEEGDEIPVGDLRLKVLCTPGHSLGGICFFETTTKAILFSGDTLFKDSIGRTDISGGDYDTLMRSIRDKIMENHEIPDDCLIAPGHEGTSTKQYERLHNMFRADWENIR